MPPSIVLLENGAYFCSVHLGIQVPRNDAWLGETRGKGDQLIRLYLPFRTGIFGPLKVGGEEADLLPIDIEGGFSDRHLVAHEVLRRAYDGPLRQDHHSFNATCKLRYVVAIPGDPGFRVHQSGDQCRIVVAADRFSDPGCVWVQFHEVVRSTIQIEDVVSTVAAVGDIGLNGTKRGPRA